MRLVAVTLLSFVGSALVFSGWVIAGPGEVAARAFQAVLLVPLLWAGMMVYSYYDELAWRPAALFTALSLCSGILILVSESVV